MRSTSVLVAAFVTVSAGCDSEPERPAECQAYLATTNEALQQLPALTAAHETWLEQLARPLAEGEDWQEGPRAEAESSFRERCNAVGNAFRSPAQSLHVASTGTPVEAPASRAASASEQLLSTCADLQHDQSLGADRAARERLLSSALDGVRSATEAARSACGST